MGIAWFTASVSMTVILGHMALRGLCNGLDQYAATYPFSSELRGCSGLPI